MHIAVLFARFGPYHLARLEAAGRLAATAGDRVTGIEIARTDALYAWGPVEGGGTFHKMTLFPDRSVEDIGPRELAATLGTVLDREDPDLVAIPGWSAAEALTALHWTGTHNVPALLLSDSARMDAPRRAVTEAIKRRLVRRYSAGFVAGRRHADYLNELGMPADRITQGYDVVDNSHFERGADASRANAAGTRQTLGLPDRYFLASSRFVAKKNLPRLLDAFAQYRRRTRAPAWDLVVCGDGEQRPMLEAQAHRLGLAAAIHFPGFIGYRELPAYYGLAGAFIQASTVEQWGLVVNEAAAAGLPLLVSEPSGCAPELVSPGRNGFTFDPTDTNALAALMTALAEGERDLAAMGRASRAIVAEWDTGRFAAGLLAAAATALRHPVGRLSLFDRLLIRQLERR